MTPHLTANGRILLMAATTLIVIGAITTSWPILLLGEVLAVMLAVAYYLGIAPLLAIEEGFVGLAVAPGPSSTGGGRGAVTGAASTLEVEVVNVSGLRFAHLTLEPEHAAALRVEPATIALTDLGPRQRVRLNLEVSAEATGRWMLHGFRVRAEGLTGLVAVSDYVPVPLPLKFLPRTQTAHGHLPQMARSADVRQVGTHRRRRRGLGSDFRELRDHAIGDPFRSIAWKATARTGRLMVREFEDEVIANTFVLLDISSTMRGGTPPHTKLEHGIRLTSEFAALLARRQHRIGLITFDEVVYGHLKTGSARSLLPAIVNHLVGLNSVLDGDLTELDDDEVVAELVRYLMVQERLDFRRQAAGRKDIEERGPFEVELLDYWLDRALPRERERLDDRCLSAAVVNRSSLSKVRRYCQLRGVPVPYRLEARFGAKEKGMVDALERFLEDKRESHFVILLSDLCGLVDTREIVSALRLVQSRKHRLVVLMPYTPDFVDLTEPLEAAGSQYEREGALTRVFRLAERRERSRIAREISALGMPVIPTGPDDTLDAILRRIDRYRRG